jgi:hypothetical protein
MTIVQSTNDVYAAIIAAFLSYVPSGNNSEMPATPLSDSSYLGGRVWVTQAKDNPTFPYALVRLGHRQRDLGTHGLMETAELEIKVFNRPRTTAAQQQLQLIGDQIEAALTDWTSSAGGGLIKVFGKQQRDTIFYSQSPADRDVVLEFLTFAVYLGNYALATEIGRSG